uniref:Uncharacterized protein n=1 Tax=Salix viminalis TaxID=40686 RepID=A0A6N2LJM1_SALVM
MISWMEKFVQKGTEITAPVPMAPPGTTGLGGFEVPSSKGGTLRSDASALNVGVLHLEPTLEVFPLLADPKMYEPNTIDLSDHNELEYWFTVLSEHLSDLVDKANNKSWTHMKSWEWNYGIALSHNIFAYSDCFQASNPSGYGSKTVTILTDNAL